MLMAILQEQRLLSDLVERPVSPALPAAQKSETITAKTEPDWGEIPPPGAAKAPKTKPTTLDALVKPPKTKTAEPAKVEASVEPPKTEAKNCEECGAATGRAHHPACPNNEGPPEPDLSGGEIQGRTPGEEG